MVSGPDAFEFLQGQLSNDLLRLAAEESLLCAWCNPKGRVICLLTVSGAPAEYALSVPSTLADAIVQRLTMFRFRSKVEFEVLAETGDVDPAALIEQGIPWIGPEQTEKFTPHMLNLDRLDAVSLDKGCYTGQEIVARTHYKGASKRRMLRFESDGSVQVGDKISDGERDIGDILNVAGRELLAVIPIAKSNQQLSVDDIRLQLRSLPYEIEST